MVDIAVEMIKKNGCMLEKEELKETLGELIEKHYGKKDFGNARGVRNLIEAVLRRQNVRIASLLQEDGSKVTNEMLVTIMEQDILEDK